MFVAKTVTANISKLSRQIGNDIGIVLSNIPGGSTLQRDVERDVLSCRLLLSLLLPVLGYHCCYISVLASFCIFNISNDDDDGDDVLVVVVVVGC